MWRRVLLVPWPVTVSNPDQKLRRHLRAELSGVLRWAVEGCLDWQRGGLRPPAVVKAAVDEYREAEDHVGRFIADRCELGSDLVVSAKDLRVAYEEWAESEGEDAFSAKALGGRLTDRGIRAVKDVAGIRGRGWQGIAFATHATDATRPGESPSYARAREHFPRGSADASQASQPDGGKPVETPPDGGAVGPVCPMCNRVDRASGADEGCRTCRQFLEATGRIPPEPRAGPAAGHPGDEMWS